jgi:hypothetical protein
MSKLRSQRPERRTLASLAVELATSPLGLELRARAGSRVPQGKRSSDIWAELVCEHAEALVAELKKRDDAQKQKAAQKGSHE